MTHLVVIATAPKERGTALLLARNLETGYWHLPMCEQRRRSKIKALEDLIEHRILANGGRWTIGLRNNEPLLVHAIDARQYELHYVKLAGTLRTPVESGIDIEFAWAAPPLFAHESGMTPVTARLCRRLVEEGKIPGLAVTEA